MELEIVVKPSRSKGEITPVLCPTDEDPPSRRPVLDSAGPLYSAISNICKSISCKTTCDYDCAMLSWTQVKRDRRSRFEEKSTLGWRSRDVPSPVNLETRLSYRPPHCRCRGQHLKPGLHSGRALQVAQSPQHYA